jgi:hypothetical protein
MLEKLQEKLHKEGRYANIIVGERGLGWSRSRHRWQIDIAIIQMAN